MGGNSLQAGILCSRLRGLLKLEQTIPVVWVFQCQTIEALAARLAEAAGDTSAMPPLRATSSPKEGALAPLSFQQVRPALKSENRCQHPLQPTGVDRHSL